MILTIIFSWFMVKALVVYFFGLWAWYTVVEYRKIKQSQRDAFRKYRP